MKVRNRLIFLVLTISSALSCAGGYKRLHTTPQNLPFKMDEVRLPSIPSGEVTLTDFGAVGDGTFLCTDAFAKAFKALESRGGGKLIVPDGIWLTGPIGLKSHTELHLADNAVIVFSSDEDLYPIIDTNFEGLDVRRCLSPIHADGETDIAITGKGTIDGSGDAWREVKKAKVGSNQWKQILARGGVLADDGKAWYPNEGYKQARMTAGSLNKAADYLDENFIKTFLRPVLVSVRNCERVLLDGPTFQNSPAWNIHPLWCKDVTINNITVRNPHYSTNGDGIDIEACENVILTNSSFDVGDDAICIKSGKDEDGRRHARACRNLYIDNCIVYHGHGGFVVGSEMSGGVENILVQNCRFMGTDVGLRFKSTRGRGGLVKDIWCHNIYMKDIITYGVIFNLYYEGKSEQSKSTASAEGTPFVADNMADAPQGVPSASAHANEASALPAVDETTPEFRDIHFEGIVCAGADQAIYINGLPELPISGLDFHNSIFTAKKGVEVNYAKDVTFDNVKVNGKVL